MFCPFILKKIIMKAITCKFVYACIVVPFEVMIIVRKIVND
jgi:hypothetical protein